MSTDPLAEKYTYNSTYAFQENKMGMGRELEGLEMTSERSKDGKSVTLTMSVRPINNSNSVSNEQFNTLINSRMENTAKVLSGPIGNGVTVIATVVSDPKSTLKMELNDALDSKGVKSLEGKPTVEVQATLDQAIVITSDSNTQVNRTQVDIARTLTFDKDGKPVMNPESINSTSNTGTHEDLHALGLGHVDDKKNIMNRENYGANVITPEQRKSIVDKSEKEQN